MEIGQKRETGVTFHWGGGGGGGGTKTSSLKRDPFLQ